MSAQLARYPFRDRAQQSDAARFGMWVFLGTEVLFFAPLVMGYVYARMHFPDGFAAGSRQTHLVLGTLNTAILLTSSLTMALAVETRRANATRLAQRFLFMTAALGILFLVLKGFEYYREWQEHLVPGLGLLSGEAGQAAVTLFYYVYFAMTGVHALHLTAGIAIVASMAASLARGGSRAVTAERVEIAGLYWHFVDIVWIFLYPMLYLVGRAP
jgi:cytochrome c oxidase subunit 3